MHQRAQTVMRLANPTPSIAALALAAVLSAHCTSASTNVAAPSGDKCQITAASQPASFGPSGGDGAVSISTQRECTWTVAADAGWVSVKGRTTGQGDATVPFAVAANVVPAVRVGAIVVADARLPLTQAAAPCRYDLSRTADTISAAGGSLSFGITTLTGCAWTAASTVSWIAVASGAAGNASGTIALTVAPNGGASRVGQIAVGGQAFTVTQQGLQEPSPSPPADPASVFADFEGAVSGLTGRCPVVAFVVSGTRVVTSNDTEFRKGNCRDLSAGDLVRVRGLRRPDGMVEAGRIDFKSNGDDDDD